MFLPAANYFRWSVCPGSAALEESEPEDWPKAPAPTRLAEPDSVNALVAAYKAQGASVQLKLLERVDLATITGERGAVEVVDAVIVAESNAGSTLHLIQNSASEDELRLLGLASLLKHNLLNDFKEIRLQSGVGSVLKVSSDDLYVFGKAATEAANVALQLRGNVTALSHLVPSEPQCSNCAAKARCPALAAAVVEAIAPPQEEVRAEVPQTLEELLADPARYGAALDLLPLVTAWSDAVLAKKRELAGSQFPDNRAPAGTGTPPLA